MQVLKPAKNDTKRHDKARDNLIFEQPAAIQARHGTLQRRISQRLVNAIGQSGGLWLRFECSLYSVGPLPRPGRLKNVPTPNSGKMRFNSGKSKLILRVRLALLLFASGGQLCSVAYAQSSSAGQNFRGLPSNSVVDQIGVVIHLGFFNTPYNKFDAIVRPRLLDLGIRHVRDSALTTGNSGALGTYYKRLSTLAADGIKSCLVVYDATSPAYSADLTKLGEVYSSAGRAVEFFEGTNEPNLKKIPNWAQIGRDRQKQLYEAVHSNPALSHVAVLGPSPWGASAQQLGDVSASVDYGNWHTYSGGQHPEATGKGGLTDYLTQAKGLYGSKPIVATEAGYHSAMNVPRPKHRPTPENIVARYLPRLVLWNLKSGVVRTYIYELIDSFAKGDTDPESNFGLVRYDGSPKPSYFAIKNLIRVFSDAGTVAKPQKLDWSLTSRSAETKSMLFQRSDGTFLLAVWLGESAWDPDQRAEISVKPVSTELTLPAIVNKATVFEFSDAGAVSERDASIHGGRLPLVVKDTLTVIKLQ